jgi:L-glyceraldehyde 3-phosphate reductase
MWPGPYGDWGSRKYLIASLDQSLKRMGLDYVDIFYSHRPDPDTPLEETMMALDYAVRSGKVQRGQNLLLEAFGGGFTWASALLRY